jgi:hypothetical protein
MTNPNEDKTRDDDKPFVLISRPSEVSAYNENTENKVIEEVQMNPNLEFETICVDIKIVSFAP